MIVLSLFRKKDQKLYQKRRLLDMRLLRKGILTRNPTMRSSRNRRLLENNQEQTWPSRESRPKNKLRKNLRNQVHSNRIRNSMKILSRNACRNTQTSVLVLRSSLTVPEYSYQKTTKSRPICASSHLSKFPTSSKTYKQYKRKKCWNTTDSIQRTCLTCFPIYV